MKSVEDRILQGQREVKQTGDHSVWVVASKEGMSIYEQEADVLLKAIFFTVKSFISDRENFNTFQKQGVTAYFKVTAKVFFY